MAFTFIAGSAENHPGWWVERRRERERECLKVEREKRERENITFGLDEQRSQMKGMISKLLL